MKRKESSIKISDRKFISVEDACQYFSLGRCKTREVAEKFGAISKIGKRVLVDRVKMEAKISELSSQRK